jgi:hypothetical protein
VKGGRGRSWRGCVDELGCGLGSGMGMEMKKLMMWLGLVVKWGDGAVGRVVDRVVTNEVVGEDIVAVTGGEAVDGRGRQVGDIDRCGWWSD